MKLAILLHFYQPHNQQLDILERIVNECYRPIVKGLLDRPSAKITINISGALIDLLRDNSYQDVLDDLRALVARGQVELTGSAKYHAFLPLLSEAESIRQIKLNQRSHVQNLGLTSEPSGFFSPEMAVSPNVLNTIKNQGYKWIAAPQVAYGKDRPATDRIYRDRESGMVVFFRHKRISILMLSGISRTADDLIRETRDLHDVDKYWFVVMDAETFGHHRIGHENFLFQVMDHKFFQPVRVGDLIDDQPQVDEVGIRPSTWTNEEQDFWLDKDLTEATVAKSFILWKDPDNPIHTLQWELTNYVIDEVTRYREQDADQWKMAREQLDYAIASDQYWWASAKPWWSLEMIELGAYTLREVIETLFGRESSQFKHADGLYRGIVDHAFEWQRTGYIRQKHLANSGTYMQQPFRDRTSAEWFDQMVLEFEDEMKKSAERQDYEKAIKWRDALTKLKLGTDMYDVLHVVDELWTARNVPSLKPFFSHEWNEISSYAKSHLRDFVTSEGFESAKRDSPYRDMKDE